MAVKVYVDVLFLTNLIFDYILLWASSVFVKKIPKPLKMLIASMVGAFFAIIAFFYAKNTASVVFFQLFTSSLMVILVFGVKDFFGYVRMSAVLFVTAFTLGGAMLYLVKNDGVISSGGAFYIDVSMPTMFLAGIFTYFLSSISYSIVLKRREQADNECFFTVKKGNEKITLKGFVDSGNKVKDENGRGVIFVSENVFKGFDEEKNAKNEIFVETVAGKSNLLSFTADEIYTDKAAINPKRKIALVKDGILKDKEAILPNDFFDYI